METSLCLQNHDKKRLWGRICSLTRIEPLPTRTHHTADRYGHQRKSNPHLSPCPIERHPGVDVFRSSAQRFQSGPYTSCGELPSPRPTQIPISNSRHFLSLAWILHSGPTDACYRSREGPPTSNQRRLGGRSAAGNYIPPVT